MKYKVIIGLERFEYANTSKEVWNIIKNLPFGTLYEVVDVNGVLVDEFIPF